MISVRVEDIQLFTKKLHAGWTLWMVYVAGNYSQLLCMVQTFLSPRVQWRLDHGIRAWCLFFCSHFFLIFWTMTAILSPPLSLSASPSLPPSLSFSSLLSPLSSLPPLPLLRTSVFHSNHFLPPSSLLIHPTPYPLPLSSSSPLLENNHHIISLPSHWPAHLQGTCVQWELYTTTVDKLRALSHCSNVWIPKLLDIAMW